MTPATCPRCKRGSAEWTVERDQFRAGCPCGELISVFFDDEELVATPVTTKMPTDWREETTPDGHRCGFGSSTQKKVTWLLLPFLGGAVFTAAQMVAASHHEHFTWQDFVIWMLIVAAPLGYLSFVRHRPWTFTFGGGRFRADTWGKHVDIALEDILHFKAMRRTGPKGRRTETGFEAPFQLSLTCTLNPTFRVPLFVSAAEAEFIADRANELLASGGREESGGYRGPQIRVADDAVVATPEPVLLEEDEEVSEPRPAEKRTLGR